MSLVRSPLAFLVLFIQVLSLCLLVSLAKGLANLLIFSKNQLLVLLILCTVLFVSNRLISALIFIISYPLLLLCVLASYFFFLQLSGVLLNCWYGNFGYVVPSFSLNSRNSLISISSLTQRSLCSG